MEDGLTDLLGGKVITILKYVGHKVMAVTLRLHNLADDINTVKRAIDIIGKPTILVGHSYGGEVISNAGYNNPNVTGLVYLHLTKASHSLLLSMLRIPLRGS